MLPPPNSSAPLHYRRYRTVRCDKSLWNQKGKLQRCGERRTCGMLLISNLLLAGNLAALAPLGFSAVGPDLTWSQVTTLEGANMSNAAFDAANLPYADGDFYAFEQMLTEKEQDRLAEVREFLTREVKPIAVDCWNRGEFPMDLIPKLGELDLVSPVRRQGYSNLFAGMLHAEVTRADASIATFMGVHDGLFTGSIEALASQEQKDAWLPDIYSLKKIGAFGLTEPLGGSDVAGGTRTTARRDGDNWILNGAKRWIGNATFSDWVVIYAKDLADNQVKAFLVDTSLPGYSATKIENKISLRTVQNADIVLDDVVVPDFFKLANGNSFRDTNKVLKVTRLAVAWQAVGAADGCLRCRPQLRRGASAVRASACSVPVGAKPTGADPRKHCGLHGHDGSSGPTRRRRSGQGRAVSPGKGLHYGAHARKRRPGTQHPGRQWHRHGLRHGQDLLGCRAIYSYEGTHEINTLVTGRAITGVSAIV